MAPRSAGLGAPILQQQQRPANYANRHEIVLKQKSPGTPQSAHQVTIPVILRLLFVTFLLLISRVSLRSRYSCRGSRAGCSS